jgi:hypothetical protein
MTDRVVTTADELTPDWLSEALGREIVQVSVAAVGTGQIGACFRVAAHERAGGVTRLLAKLPAADPGARAMLAGAYRNEVRFYTSIANTVRIRVPACRYAALAGDGPEFTLLLDDLAPASQGDQVRGCTLAQARDAVVNLAGLHGPRWCDPTLFDIEGLAATTPADAAMLAEVFAPAVDVFVDSLGPLLTDADVRTLRECVPVTEAWALARPRRFGLIHGDYRLDNLLFPPDEAPGVAAVDWQTLTIGLPTRDLAYFVTTTFDAPQRRANEYGLVAAYHDALTGHGVADYGLERCWDDYRFAALQGPLIAVLGAAYGNPTERGNRMFAAMVARSCAAIRDLGTLGLIRALETTDSERA